MIGKKINLGRCQNLEIEILDYVVSICNQYNLKYSLFYGTLLGAIRHKGFIPWDDDIDICMPDEDYEQFCDIMRYCQSDRFKVLIPNENGYYYEFAKVIDTRTVLYEHNIDHSFEMGVWIDIFPLHGVGKRYGIVRYCMNLLNYARIAAVYSVPPPSPNYLKPLIWCGWKIIRLLGYKLFLKRILSIAARHPYKDAEYVTCLIAHDTNRYCFNKKLFENLMDVEFEGKLYQVFCNYDEFLKTMYGDYMQLPPENQRIHHEFDVYWKKDIVV